MRLIKAISISGSLLFVLAICMPSCVNSLTVIAQTQSGPLKIEGEQFEGMVIVMPKNSLLHTYYNFGKQGKVICQRLVVTPAQTTRNQQYNTITEKWEWVTGFIPGSVLPFSPDEIGTYTQTDDRVRLTFSDRYIEAKLKVEGAISGLDGTTTFKGSNRKEQFLIVRKHDVLLSDTLPKRRTKRRTPSDGVNLTDLIAYDDKLIIGDDESYRPANGYRWVNAKDPDDLRVELMPGLIRAEDGHIRPAKGYRWVNPKDAKDLRVEAIP